MMFGVMGLAILGSIGTVVVGRRQRAALINNLAEQNRERRENGKE